MSSQTGKGGTVVIWSDQVTEFDGTINAKGAEKVPISGSIDNYTKFENSGKDHAILSTFKK